MVNRHFFVSRYTLYHRNMEGTAVIIHLYLTLTMIENKIIIIIIIIIMSQFIVYRVEW